MLFAELSHSAMGHQSIVHIALSIRLQHAAPPSSPVHSFPLSSSCSAVSSSMEIFCCGQPTTRPSLSVSLGLGMTWKWTWSTSWCAMRPLFWEEDVVSVRVWKGVYNSGLVWCWPCWRRGTDS